MIQETKKILESIKSGSLKPYYILHGDEPYFIDQISDFMAENAIPEFERGFNQQILYGKDVTVTQILNYARAYPMMGENQVVIIKEAQDIPKLLGKESAEITANIAQLEAYFGNPQPSTVLVMCFKSPLDQRKTWVKNASKNGVLFQTKKMYDNQIADWLTSYVAELQLKINRTAAQIVVEYIGNNLSRMASEMDKLAVNLRPNQEITAAEIEKFIGISKDYNIFEWQKAISQRNIKKSFNIGFYLADNQKEIPLQVNLISLFNHFLKIMQVHTLAQKSESAVASLLKVNPFFAKDYIQAVQSFSLPQCANVVNQIKTADLRLKGVERGSMSDKEIVQDLIFNILA